MAIKVIDYDEKIKKTVVKTETVGTETVKYEVTHCRTDFVADAYSDITAMNLSGSEYLDYPAGSSVVSAGSGKVYILNASETEYKEI